MDGKRRSGKAHTDVEGGMRERRTPEAIPPEVERGLYLDFMDQHYQRWVDEAVPALNGLSPREAVAAKGGRSRVAELIRQIEHGQIMQQREKGFAYAPPGSGRSWGWIRPRIDGSVDGRSGRWPVGPSSVVYGE